MTRPPPFIIRNAVAADIPALSRLLELLFAIESDFVADPVRQQRGLALLLERPGQAVVLVAAKGSQVIGMCTAQVLVSTAQGGEVALVEDVVVDADYRGEGVGAALLGELEQWGAARGITRLQLLADRSNDAALAFYRRRGWLPTELVAWRKFIAD